MKNKEQPFPAQLPTKEALKLNMRIAELKRQRRMIDEQIIRNARKHFES